jgi:hypothetical protein
MTSRARNSPHSIVVVLAALLSTNSCTIPRYYSEYFQISDGDIRTRMKCALMHDARFHVVATQTPDLYTLHTIYRYGPFWIQTTLIFILIVGTVLNEYYQQ